MSRAEVQIGQAWVAARLREAAEGLSIPLDAIEWVQTSKGFDEGYELLVVTSLQRDFRERFSETHLEDCANTPSVQHLLRLQIRNMLLSMRT